MLLLFQAKNGCEDRDRARIGLLPSLRAIAANYSPVAPAQRCNADPAMGESRAWDCPLDNWMRNARVGTATKTVAASKRIEANNEKAYLQQLLKLQLVGLRAVPELSLTSNQLTMVIFAACRIYWKLQTDRENW